MYQQLNFGLDDLGIESRLGARFSTPIQTCRGAHPVMGTGSFPVVKRLGGGINHPSPSRTKVKEREELYHYSTLWALVACSKVTFTFTFYQQLEI